MGSIIKFIKDVGGVGILSNLTIRYLMFIGIAYFVFYVWRHKQFWASKIQQRYPGKKDIIREIFYSTCTILIFGVVVLAVTWAGYNGHTRFYRNISDRGILISFSAEH